MKIVQVKTNTVSATGVEIENKLPDFNNIRKGLLSSIDLKLSADIKEVSNGMEITLFGYFDHEKYCQRYGSEAFFGFLEKLQKITQSSLIIDTSGEDYTITIYDDYIE